MQAHRTPGEVVTYFVQAAHGGPIKIGKSCRNILASRVASLQTGNPHPLVVRRTMRGNHEPDYHYQFREHRLCGEWFTPTPDLRKLARATLGEAHSDPIQDAYIAGFRDGVAEGMVHATDCIDLALREVDRARGEIADYRPRDDDAEDVAKHSVRDAYERFVTTTRQRTAHETAHVACEGDETPDRKAA